MKLLGSESQACIQVRTQTMSSTIRTSSGCSDLHPAPPPRRGLPPTANAISISLLHAPSAPKVAEETQAPTWIERRRREVADSQMLTDRLVGRTVLWPAANAEPSREKASVVTRAPWPTLAHSGFGWPWVQMHPATSDPYHDKKVSRGPPYQVGS